MNLPRLVLIAAVVAGVSYVGSWVLGLPPTASTTWKGAGVALLALYAALNARDADGWLLALVLAFGALGDVLLETHGLVTGALAFLAGHLVAIGLYLRNRRALLKAADWTIAVLLMTAIPIAAYLAPPVRAGAGLIALYAVGLAAMAAAAWLSRFPRSLVALGALMFAVSDLLIFVRTGRPALDGFPMALAVWGLYFAGQALIAVGVAGARRSLPQPDLAPPRPS